MIYFFPTVMSIPVETVARAMINNAVNLSSPSGIEIYVNKQIHKLGKESDWWQREFVNVITSKVKICS